MGTYHRGDRIRLWGTFWVNQTTLALSSAAGATTITVRDVTGYADTNPIVLAPGTSKEELAAVSGTPTAAGVVTLAAALRYGHSVGDVVGELQTPSTHAIRTRNPAGTEASNASTEASTGRVRFDLDIPDAAASSGTWAYRPIGSVGVLASDEQEFLVEASAFA
jgi:hypothetical protein